MTLVRSLILLIFFGQEALTLSDPCNVSPTLTRTIKNEGFHRELVYAIEIKDSLLEECTLVIQETLSESFFVKKDQLADLTRLGELFTHVDSLINIEAPESVSEPHNVSIYTSLKASAPSRTLKASARLPIHVRYHSPQEGGGHVKAFFNEPKIFTHCPTDIKCDKTSVQSFPCSPGDDEYCTFQELQTIFDVIQYIYIPVGNVDDQFLVTTITFLVTIFGSAYILKALLSVNKNSKKC